MNKDILDYLESIRSSTDRSKYKLVHSSPIRYGGGKSRAVGYILERIPYLQNKRIVSIFVGGGSVELALHSLGYEIVAYDVFILLVEFWYVLKHHKPEFLSELQKLIPDKEHYGIYRQVLMDYWNTIKPETLVYNTRKRITIPDDEKHDLLDVIKRVAYYYYNHQLSYGPSAFGWPSNVYLSQEKYNKIIAKLEATNLTNFNVHCMSFEQSIPRHQSDFLYLDPPYVLKDTSPDSTMFKGLYPNRNFAIHHDNFDHERLRDLLYQHNGGFILTYNNCSKVLEWYSDYDIYFPEWHYSFGQGETRIGKNREEYGEYVKRSHEVIIVSTLQL